MSKGMMYVMGFAIAMMIASLLGMCLIGCDLPPPPGSKPFLQDTNAIAVLTTPAPYSNVLVVRDGVNKVTCYMTPYSTGAISCVPDQPTK